MTVHLDLCPLVSWVGSLGGQLILPRHSERRRMHTCMSCLLGLPTNGIMGPYLKYRAAQARPHPASRLRITLCPCHRFNCKAPKVQALSVAPESDSELSRCVRHASANSQRGAARCSCHLQPSIYRKSHSAKDANEGGKSSCASARS